MSAVRRAIEEGEYRPGVHLRLQALVEDLGMSPTPIREALRMLQAEGLVVHHPHRGVVVAESSPDELLNVYGLRLELEPLATRWAAERMSDEELAGIRAIHDELLGAVKGGGGDDERTIDLNGQWHMAIYRSAGSTHLLEFIERLWLALPLKGWWIVRSQSAAVGEHSGVMAALENHEQEQAARLMRAHLQTAADATMRHWRAITPTRGRRL